MIAAILVSLIGMIILPLYAAVHAGKTTGVRHSCQASWVNGIAGLCHVRWTHSIRGVHPTMGRPEQNQKWTKIIVIEETSRKFYCSYPLATGHCPPSTPIAEYITDRIVL